MTSLPRCTRNRVNGFQQCSRARIDNSPARAAQVHSAKGFDDLERLKEEALGLYGQRETTGKPWFSTESSTTCNSSREPTHYPRRTRYPIIAVVTKAPASTAAAHMVCRIFPAHATSPNKSQHCAAKPFLRQRIAARQHCATLYDDARLIQFEDVSDHSGRTTALFRPILNDSEKDNLSPFSYVMPPIPFTSTTRPNWS